MPYCSVSPGTLGPPGGELQISSMSLVIQGLCESSSWVPFLTKTHKWRLQSLGKLHVSRHPSFLNKCITCFP